MKRLIILVPNCASETGLSKCRRCVSFTHSLSVLFGKSFGQVLLLLRLQIGVMRSDPLLRDLILYNFTITNYKMFLKKSKNKDFSRLNRICLSLSIDFSDKSLEPIES